MLGPNSVYLAWQAPDTREWHVVGLLTQRNNSYIFNYTRGVLASPKFIPFSGMNDFYKTYVSSELFPLFKNRLLSTRRPEYPGFMRWLGLHAEDANAISVLGRSGGLRGTDQLQMFKRIEIQSDGSFEHIFFAHGLGHLSDSASARVSALKDGEQLYLCLDCQNPFDENAVLIRANDPAEILGYCPRFIAKDVGDFLKYRNDSVKLYVETLSDDAPSNYKLMCKLKGSVEIGFASRFMDRPEFLPLLS